MIDFLMIATRTGKRGVIEIYPKFIIKKSKDLMIRGSDFYAVWLEKRGLWSTDEQDALQLIDMELERYADVAVKVRLLGFDVPQSSVTKEALQNTASEMEWRLNVEHDHPEE